MHITDTKSSALRRGASLLAAAGVALGLVLAGAVGPAAASRGSDLCGGSDYVLKFSDSFLGGRAAVSKNKTSSTWCLVVFNTTGRRGRVAATIQSWDTKSGRIREAKDVGNYADYAGPVYLGALPKDDVMSFMASGPRSSESGGSTMVACIVGTGACSLSNGGG
jgi:hypothetical protein